MSTFRNPVGPQAPRVYWRRRLVVGLVLLAVVIIIVMIVSQLNRITPTPVGTSTPSATSSSTAAPTAAAGDKCDPAKVVVDPLTDAASYEAGVNPVLSFSLKSTMTVPCTLAVGSDVQEFRVTSGDELIWTSKDCQTGQVAAVVTLQPGVPKGGPSITWDRTRSSTDTCTTAREQVVAGGASYHLDLIVGDVSSAADKSKQFLLY